MNKLSEPFLLLSIPGTNKFRVLNKVIYRSEAVGDVFIKPGKTTDLATIPWWLRWSYSRSSKIKDPAIIHDDMTKTPGYLRAQCDSVFKEALIDAGVHAINVFILYAGVRIYAFYKGLK